MGSVKVYNCVENAVREVFDSIYEDFTGKNPLVCTCTSCRGKALAKSLNGLAPNYVSSEAELFVSRVYYQAPAERARLMATVVEAIRETALQEKHAK